MTSSSSSSRLAVPRIISFIPRYFAAHPTAGCAVKWPFTAHQGKALSPPAITTWQVRSADCSKVMLCNHDVTPQATSGATTSTACCCSGYLSCRCAVICRRMVPSSDRLAQKGGLALAFASQPLPACDTAETTSSAPKALKLN